MPKPLGEKWVLIVDDEEAILAVLQKSLKKLGDDYRVVTATDGLAALEQLKSRPFDLVVTDYKMAGMTGLELLQAIRGLQSGARIILMTAYGNDKLEAETRRQQAYQYLTKPLELDTFRQIVRGAFEDVAISRPGILILSDERYVKVNELLTQLQVEVGARCIFLTNAEGHFLAKIGDLRRLPLEQIATLVGGSIATLLEAGRIIDGEGDTINLAYREGKRENLYVVNIGTQLLLIIVSERGTYSSKLGTVWYYAQKAAQALRQQLGEAEYASPSQVVMEDLEQATGSALDELFDNAWQGAAASAAPWESSKP